MKVLDLKCAGQHVFEGWFASEDDFQSQLARELVQCPLCGDAAISKQLSAPRLNLGATPQLSAPLASAPAAPDALVSVGGKSISRELVPAGAAPAPIGFCAATTGRSTRIGSRLRPASFRRSGLSSKP